jgi:signal peptidase I
MSLLEDQEPQPVPPFDLVPDPAPPESDVPPRPRLTRLGWLRDIIETLVIFVVIAVLMNLLTARFIVDGPSMHPNFATGQYVIVNRLAYLTGEPRRGDIAVLQSPEDPGTDLIKRIIGLPGETVAIHDGLVFINGTPLSEPYLNAPPNYQGEWSLSAVEYFVLGDNRTNSRDSHNFGPLPREALIGRAAAIYWPPQDWRVIAPFDYAESGLSMAPAILSIPAS